MDAVAEMDVELKWWSLSKLAEMLHADYGLEFNGKPVDARRMRKFTQQKNDPLIARKFGGTWYVLGKVAIDWFSRPGGPLVSENATPQQTEERREAMRESLRKLGIG